ncbi:MAG: hypothetical protein QY330_01405 [Candidatus Dojkabacteria bacterium]|uniref:DUF5667 domain-containing protein n=2 Tax=Candidatus Dojkabacteria TaxID=74243 RepID=A0A136KJB0_9BACT|nr:MAG: hypothetical protein UZ20_WS6002000548 [candidate division WS6 bacterium OLB21]MBW7953916.1 hypothetical protein [Candidatus Dojkabacteria bacterium]WKZ28246.1 MAG: hypothetical protein QY330_01405 [Candidatus Dojkabacteria bacterium]
MRDNFEKLFVDSANSIVPDNNWKSEHRSNFINLGSKSLETTPQKSFITNALQILLRPNFVLASALIVVIIGISFLPNNTISERAVKQDASTDTYLSQNEQSYTLAVNKIEETENLIAELEATVDVAKAKLEVEIAKELVEKKDYNKAIRYATDAQARLNYLLAELKQEPTPSGKPSVKGTSVKATDESPADDQESPVVEPTPSVPGIAGNDKDPEYSGESLNRR